MSLPNATAESTTQASRASEGSAVPDYWDCFKADYATARTTFLDAARQAGATLTTYLHPTAVGPSGEALHIDVAYLGAATAPSVLLAISGTHGLEGPAGSAIQIAYLKTMASHPLPDDVALLFLHGLNPYGFAHASRTTENNVDLNRNFVDHAAPYPENPLYASLHDYLIPDAWNGQTLALATKATAAFKDAHGDDVLFDTLARGQYTHPQGLMYGGDGREWSNRILETVIATHLEDARQVAFIDWHTGIGDYASPFFLCFNETGSALEAQAARWWGADRVLQQRPNGLQRPQYQGLVFHGVKQFLGSRPMVGAVVEFGTRGKATGRASRLDQWLRFKAPLHPDPARDAVFHADVIDTMVTSSSVWRTAVIDHGLEITQQAIDGLRAWTL